jgi:outer membrane biogenesis lipoprotein LolB
MKRFKGNLLLLLAALLLVAACEEDKPAPGPTPPDPVTQPAGKKEQISKIWKADAMLVNNSPAQGVDFSGYTFQFKADNTYSFVAGTYSGTGPWEFNSNAQQVILDKGTQNQRSAAIISLSSSRLELEFTEPATPKTGERKILFKLKP